MMLSELFQAVNAQAVKAAEPKAFHPDAEPEHVYWFEGKRQEAMPEVRNHSAADLSAIIAWAEKGADYVVWYHRAGVVVLLDDKDRRDRVTLPLSFSPQVQTIFSWGEQSKPFKQTALVLMLRTLFKHCLEQSPRLLDSLKRLKFSAEGTGTVAPARGVSVSRTVALEAMGADALPEEFILDVPIFHGVFAGQTGRVEVALEVDAGSQQFALLPIPGSLERCIRAAEAWIGEQLSAGLGGDGDLFYGTP